MPFSDRAGDWWYEQKILEISPKTVLDVGAGAGKYGDMCRSLLPDSRLTAIEIWEPYIEKFGLLQKYDEVLVKDIKLNENFEYDLVIFGDVLEHMSEQEAVEIWDKAIAQAGSVILSIPTQHSPQGEYEGNSHEIHVVDDWNDERVLGSFNSIYEYKNFGLTSGFIGTQR
jgi:predicted TPR repeat methyltransferase